MMWEDSELTVHERREEREIKKVGGRDKKVMNDIAKSPTNI
jgi:ribosomal protein L44E